MTNQHPITPPPELMQQWIIEATEPFYVPTQAAQWGADQELEECVNYIDNNMSGNKAREFRAIRRPKPPSLKEQALAAVAELEGFKGVDTIRRALEALPDG